MPAIQVAEFNNRKVASLAIICSLEKEQLWYSPKQAGSKMEERAYLDIYHENGNNAAQKNNTRRNAEAKNLDKATQTPGRKERQRKMIKTKRK